MSMFLVLLLGALVVGAALVTVTQRNPVHAALSMLVALAGLALLFLGLRAPFLAAMQVLLYGGAIMVLFVFVIMLLTLREDEMGPPPSQERKITAAIGAVLLVGVLMFAISRRTPVELQAPRQDVAQAANEASGVPVPRGARVDFGSSEHFMRFLYTDYAVPFELITVLVMAAVAGVIVLARRPDRVSLERTKITHHAGGEA